MNRFVSMEDSLKLISNGSCVRTTVWMKRLRASVSTCPFETLHTVFQTDELHPPANRHPVFGLKRRKGRRSQLRVGNSSSGVVEYVDLPLALTCQFPLCRVTESTFRQTGLTTRGTNGSLLNHAAKTTRVSAPLVIVLRF